MMPPLRRVRELRTHLADRTSCFSIGPTMPASLLRCVALLISVSCALLVATLLAQPPSTVPPNGLRDNTPACHALVGARIVVAPGKTIEKGTLVVRDGKIVAVGASDSVKT